MPYHRFRKVGDKYFDLQPVYEWIKIGSVPQRELTPEMKSKPRPMPDWVGGFSSFEFGSFDKVYQVLSNGLLIEGRSINTYTGQQSEGAVFFLTNYPYASQVADGQQIQFLALRVGTFQYTDSAGAVRTVPMFDYGVPYDPWKLLKEKRDAAALTNGPVKH